MFLAQVPLSGFLWFFASSPDLQHLLDLPPTSVSVSDRLKPDVYVSVSSEKDQMTMSYGNLLSQVYEILGTKHCPSPPQVFIGIGIAYVVFRTRMRCLTVLPTQCHMSSARSHQ